jgi:DNA-binding beta-propeller fold protein YncE
MREPEVPTGRFAGVARNMAKKKDWLAGLALGVCLVALAAAFLMSPRMLGQVAAAQGSYSGKYPVFEVDPGWPQLPNNWVLGSVSKVVVDRHDNVWIIHRPRTVGAGKTAAPPVVELDARGNFAQAWGGEGAGYDWPDAEHNVFVDYKDNVWISGSSPSGQSKTRRSDDMILKFTNNGQFIKQLGGRTTSHGSKDPMSVNKPGDLFVSPKTNELYVADGYGNRRVIVVDADTLAFKRMWGAFGKPPEDDANSGGPGPSGGPAVAPSAGGGGGGGAAVPVVLDTEGPGSDKFASPVHGVMVSNDDIVYVADRSNRRLQLFTPAGVYLKQMFVNRAGPASDSVCGLAFSPDKDQQFLYLSDLGNSHIVVVDRKTLQILYQFGKRGPQPGNFQGLHHIAMDSKGNLYTAEVAPGARAQRFNFKGWSATVPPNALTPAELGPKL